MGRRRNTRRLEERTYRETAKEMKPKPLQKLERDHTIVHHQQSIQQSDPKQNIYSPRPNATQRTGRIQERKILRRTHIHPTTYSRTVPGMENTGYVIFVNFEQAFDSIHKESLRCILRHYGIPCNTVTIMKMYEGFKSELICGQHLREEFDIKTGVKQGILSPFLFCLAIDWIMKRTHIGVKSGIIILWTFTESLGDLDFADDISLFTHSHIDIQSKTEKLVRNAAKVGLHVNKDKTKTTRNNCQTEDPVKLGEQDIEDVVTKFTYLGAKVTKDGNTEAEIKTRINKTRGAFASLKNIWKTEIISKKRIFKSSVLIVLLQSLGE